MNKVKSVVDVNGIRYELVALLGRGGQGAVYSVKGGRLAVKIIAGRGQGYREKMRNQLTLVRRMPISDLPIAKPLEMLRPPHTGYVMELLSGMTPIKHLFTPPKGESPGVEWYLRTGGLRHRLLVLARTAYILSQLHGKGLVYSDPSPANIFISEDPSSKEVWFIDTDNLCYESSPGTHTNVYTPGYGAPELVQGRSGVNTLTDAYAFAVIAFQTLTLAHPFIGDLVNDGEPELEEKAFAGLLPWIEDPDDDNNRASYGVPREWVLSSRLMDAFDRTFGEGRLTPTHRPGLTEWAELLFAAADATISCTGCEGTFYFGQSCCTWCDEKRPTFATAALYLWDPKYDKNGGILKKPRHGTHWKIMVGHAAVTSGTTITITRRLAFDSQGKDSNDPVVEVSLDNDRLTLKSCDGKSYDLASMSGKRKTTISDRPQTLPLIPDKPTWHLHFGDEESLHRVLEFCLRPRKTS